MPRVKISGQKASLRDVATLAGVAISTASQALNGKAGVTADTRAKVQEAAAKLGYRPHPLARRLARATTDAIGVIFSPGIDAITSYEIYGVVIRGILEVVTPAGFNLVFTPVPEGEAATALPRIVEERDVDGVLALSASDPHLIRELGRTGLPIVHVDSHGAPGTYAAVDNDDQLGAYLGTQHLLRMGHHSVGLIMSSAAQPFGHAVLQGYRLALEERGISVDRNLIHEVGLTVEDGYSAMRNLLAGAQAPSAVFANNDYAAIGALKAALSTGRRVPEDVAVVGMDDIALSAHLHPALTTVHIHYDQLGRLAAKMLLERMQGLPDAPLRLVVPPELIIRGSCGAQQTRLAAEIVPM